MKNRRLLILIPATIAGILLGLYRFSAEMKRQKEETRSELEELVERLQSDLPVVKEYKNSIITQTGLMIRNDSLITTYQLEAADSILVGFREGRLASYLREEGLQGLLSDYKSYRLTHLACDLGMVFSEQIYDKDGGPVYFWEYSPDDYRPLLKK